MRASGRDLLVLTPPSRQLSPEAMQRQLDALHKMLYEIESWEQFCIANEIIDLNRYRIITKPYQIRDAVREALRKPFLFVSNKN